MKAIEEMTDTIVLVGKVLGSITAMITFAKYVMDCCWAVKKYFEKTPEQELDEINGKLKVFRKNRGFFQKVSEEEKALRARKSVLEEELGYNKRGCILQ